MRRGKAGVLRRGGWVLESTDLEQLERIWSDVIDQLEYEAGPLGPNPVIIDGGANIGVASHFFQQRYPDALILAFEPGPETFSLLKRNLARNHMDRVQPFRAAIAAKTGQMPFFVMARGSWGDALVRHGWMEDASTSEISVPTVRLSSLLSGPVDLLKLDIEGVEADVLDEAWLRLSNVRRLVMEVHGSSANPSNTIERIVRRLSLAGFAYAMWQGDREVDLDSMERTDPYWLIVRAWRRDDPLGGKHWPGAR